MRSDEVARDLHDIRALMHQARRYSEVRAGWFLILWGAIWVAGFVTGQFLPEVAPVVWIALSAAGVILSVLMSAFLYGRRSPRQVPGMTRTIALAAVSLVVFDALAAWLLSLASARELTLLVVLSTALCYAMAGLLFRGVLLVAGVFLAASVVVGHILVPAYFYLTVAVIGGGALWVSGIVSLRHHR